MMDQENLDKLTQLISSNQSINICDIILSNLKIDYIDYPIIDHNTKAPYVQFPDISFFSIIPLLYIFIDMRQSNLNIDNPQFIHNHLISNYIKDTYFLDEFDNFIVKFIKQIVYEEFNLQNHIGKNTPSSEEVYAVFSIYGLNLKKLKIEILGNNFKLSGVVKTLYETI